jgi:hypothetical protein
MSDMGPRAESRDRPDLDITRNTCTTLRRHIDNSIICKTVGAPVTYPRLWAELVHVSMENGEKFETLLPYLR